MQHIVLYQLLLMMCFSHIFETFSTHKLYFICSLNFLISKILFRNKTLYILKTIYYLHITYY